MRRAKAIFESIRAQGFDTRAQGPVAIRERGRLVGEVVSSGRRVKDIVNGDPADVAER
jgi:hypothetical protein